MQVVRVSGTIRKAEEEAIRRARLSIKRARAGAAGFNIIDASIVAGAQGPSVLNEVEGMDGVSGFANGIEDPDEPGDFDEESE